MKTLVRPRTREMVRVLRIERERCEQVERSCHKYGTIGSREGSGTCERGGGIGDRLDLLEVRGAERGELCGRYRPGISRLGRDQPPAERCERPEHRVGVFVGENGGNEGV